MKQIIPIAGVPIERFNVNLNRTLYTFAIYYNARFDFWTLSMYLGETPLFESFKIVQGVDLGGLYNLNIGGRLYIESVSGDLSDPIRNDLGNDKKLIYDNTI